MPVISEPLADAQVERIYSALGITQLERDLTLPVRIVPTRHSKVKIALKARAVLERLAPDYASLIQISAEIGCNDYFPFVLTPDSSSRHLTIGRMFAPAIGISEDPVTGNANGPLGAYLVHEGRLSGSGSKVSYLASEGREMGRPGEMQVKVDLESGKPAKITISGRAVTVFETTLDVNRRHCS